MHYHTRVIILVVASLLGTVICQTKPKLPSQWYATAQITKGMEPEQPIWYFWFDTTASNAPRAKMSTLYHDEAITVSSIVTGNTVYQVVINATGGPWCHPSPIDKPFIMEIQRILLFLNGATYQGKINHNGQKCNSWINTFDPNNGYYVGGCFLADGTPVTFDLVSDVGTFSLNVYEFGTQYSPLVFSTPNPCIGAQK